MPKVTIYTAPKCMPCVMTKKWLDRENVDYEERDATESVDYLATLGYRSAPVIVTENGEHFHGFHIAKLQQIVAEAPS